MSRKIKSKVEWMNSIIETYKEDGDCRLATFIGLIRYYGVDVSINEMFGLGCGLDFSSINISVGSIKILGITGRNFEVEKSFCDRVNLKCREKISTYTPKKVFSKPFDIEILKVVSKYHLEDYIHKRITLKRY